MANLKKGSTVDGKAILSVDDVPVTPSGETLLYKGHKVYTTHDKPPAGDVDAVSASSGGTYKALVNFDRGIKIGPGQKAIDLSNGVTITNPVTGVNIEATGTKNYSLKAVHGTKTNFELTLKPSGADIELAGTLNASNVTINGKPAYHTANTTIDKNGFLRASGNKETVAVGDFGIGTKMGLKANPDPLNFDLSTGFEAYDGPGTAGKNQPPTSSSGDVAIRVTAGPDNNSVLYFNQASNKVYAHMRAFGNNKGWTEFLTDSSTTRDKNGFVRYGGSKDAVTTDQITHDLNSESKVLVVSAELASKKRDLTNNSFTGVSTLSGSGWNNGIDFFRTESTVKTHYRLMNMSADAGSFTLLGFPADGSADKYTTKQEFQDKSGTVALTSDIVEGTQQFRDWGITEKGVEVIANGTKLNSYETSGYRYNGSSSDATVTNNYPLSNSGVFFKLAPSFAGSASVESYNGLNSNRHFLRTKLNTGYYVEGGWTEILTTNQHLSQVQGTAKDKVPSLFVVDSVKSGLTTEINKKITGGSVVQVLSTSTTDVPSVKLVSDEFTKINTTLNEVVDETVVDLQKKIDTKITGGTVVQVQGTSTVDVPSQKLLADVKIEINDYNNNQLALKLDKTEVLNALGTSTTQPASQKIVNDVSDRTTTAQSRADSAYTLASGKWDIQDTTGTGNVARMSEVDKKADTTYVDMELAKKWDIQLTSGTGNIARMSEVDKKADTTYVDTELDKKRDLSDFTFDSSDGGTFIELGSPETSPNIQVAIANNSITGHFYFHDRVTKNTIYLPINNKSGTLALTSDIPNAGTKLGAEQRINWSRWMVVPNGCVMTGMAINGGDGYTEYILYRPIIRL